MLNYELIELLAAFWVAIPLIRGAIEDIKTRQFPEKYWSPFAKIAGLFTCLAYCLMIADGELIPVAEYIILSLGAALIFYGFGIRYGSGGDWRAMIYCAILTPLIFFSPVFWILLCVMSIIIAIITLAPDREEGVHIFDVHIPWAVAIAAAFCLTAIIAAVSGSFA